MINNIKKSIFLLFLLVFVGITNVSAATKNIEVTNIEVKDKSGTITVVDPVFESNEVKSNITFNQKDDFVTFELTLKNNESEKYRITSITDNNTNENIQVEYSFSKDFINTGDTSKVTLKLTYKNKLLNVDEISLNDLTITFNLESEEGKEEEIIINPVTGDNIFHYLVLLIIALVGIGLVVAKKKVKGIKVGSFFVILAVLLLPFAVFANEKYEIKVKFNDIVIKGEYETYNISIDPGNGAPVETRQITYGQELGDLPANPTKDGYTFNKWVDEEGNEVTKDTVITKQISVIASYNLVTYNITYDLDEGSLPSGKSNPDKYTIESQSITLNNPEKRGYTFAGWSGTGIDGQTTEVTIDHGSKGDRSYKAHYLAKDDTKYTVIHKFQKLTEGYDEETVEEHGTTGSTVPAPRKTRTGFITPAVQNVTIEADESASVTYVYDREEYAFSITDRTYVDSTSTADGTYPYGKEISVKAIERPGYDFAWSDGDTNVERTFELEGATSLTPVYTANTNTKYVVKHYKQKITLDGYEIADTQNLEGTTDSPITPAVNTYTGFVSPATQTTTINGDGSTVVIYNYDRESYTVIFDTDGGSTVPQQTIIYGQKVTRPETDPEKTGYTFDDWYTDDTYTTKFDFTNTIITSEKTIYAKFDEESNVCAKNENITRLSENTCSANENITVGDGIVCKRAIKLHEETCNQTDGSKYCSGEGYTERGKKGTTTLTYGNCGTSGVLRQGDAFTCDVNGDGTFNELTERFYYVGDYYNTSTLAYEDDTAVLVYYNDVVSGVSCNKGGFSYDSSNKNYNGPVSILDQLPTTTQWSNISLKNTQRQILTDTETTATGQQMIPDHDLPIFDYSGYAARFITSQEIESACGPLSFPVGYLDTCSYLMENTTYSTPNINDFSWSETPYHYSDNQVYVMASITRYFVNQPTYKNAGIRPVIEIPKNKIAIGEPTEFTVTFETNGGSSIDDQIISNGEKATRPASDPTKNGYSFVDWYKDSELTIVFNFNTPITEDTTIYAKWKKEQFPVVFSHEGECTFNGSDGVLTGDDCEYADGVNKYIDTGINLYNITNINEDYEIGFTIVSYDPYEQESQATLMNTKLEGSGYPGVVFRKRDTSAQFDISSKSTSTDNVRKYINVDGITDVKIYRIYNSELDTQEIFYSLNDGQKIKLNDLSQFNPIFNLSVWFGAAPKDATGTEAQRYLKGTLSNMYIKVGTYGEERNKFDVTFDTDGGSNVESQIVRKGGVATRPLYIPTKTGYSFVDWYADSEFTTLYDFTTPINDDTTIYAKFEANPFSLVFSHEGECTFNGKDGVLTGDNCAFADGIRKYIDTGINLYNSENHDKDYEIGFTIVSYSLENQDSQATFMNTKYEASNYPGVVFRRRAGDTTYDLSSRKTTSANETKLFEFGTINKVKIYRIYNSESGVQEIFYSINDGEKVKLNDLSKFNPEFDLSVWFGASPTDETATEARRYLTGTLSDMYIKLGTYHEEESNNYTVTLNPNGGSVSPTSITHEKNVAIGELPSPTAPAGKTFIGWYTGLTDGIKVTNTYIPSGNITIYARYYTDITGATVSPSSISILNGSNQTLTVSNVEEQYTFTSNNTAIATVDSSGKVTGTGEGTTTITITGSTSGKTRTINVTVEASTYTVTLNPNGGTVTPTSITQNKNTPIGELPTPTAPVGKVFDAWYTGLTDGVKVTSSYTPNTDIEIYARYTNQEFTVTFDTDGGTAVPSQTISYGSTATRPSTNPTKTNYTFDDWYTDDTYETKYDFDNTVITGDTTIYGNFYYQITKCAANSNRTSLSSDNCQNSENIEIGEGIVCKRAIKLHQEKCYGSSYGCYRSGYYEGGSKNTSTITYGNCGTQGNLSAGDAFTCDINADGKFDELYERFYYVSDYYDTTDQTFDSDTVVLIYYNNVIDGIACNRNNSYSYANIDDIQEVYPTAEHAYNIYGPLTITKLLPKNYQWSNVSLKKENRQILSEDSNNHDKLNTNGGVLPTSYSYSGYAARFLTVKELETNCTNGNDVYTNGVLDNCNFIFENTGYSNSGISGGTWLETPVYSENYYVWRVDSFYRDLTACVGVECGRGARPVIEVPKTKISY